MGEKGEYSECSRSNNVAYIFSKEYIDVCDEHPKTKNRASMVHALIDSYGLLKSVRCVEPTLASKMQLLQFHSNEYIELLYKIQEQCIEEPYGDDSWCSDVFDLSFDDLEQHGLGYDCSIFRRMLDYARFVAGATIKAADMLNNKECSIAVNFNGGWHHAHVDEAAGFCYVNDIVLGILKLRETFRKILYIDLDIHHGDGVQEAFLYTNKVMTVSFHKQDKGFFPGTGKALEIGKGNGRYYTVNVPLKEAVNDEQYFCVFKNIMADVKQYYKPEVVVCQCGADTLVSDPLGGFNVTTTGMTKCVELILNWKLPMLVLGGGGYNLPNTAKCWTSILASIVGMELDKDIPEHDFFESYGPDYIIDIFPGMRKSLNSTEYLDMITMQVSENLRKVCPQSPIKPLQHSMKVNATSTKSNTTAILCKKQEDYHEIKIVNTKKTIPLPMESDDKKVCFNGSLIKQMKEHENSNLSKNLKMSTAMHLLCPLNSNCTISLKRAHGKENVCKQVENGNLNDSLNIQVQNDENFSPSNNHKRSPTTCWLSPLKSNSTNIDGNHLIRSPKSSLEITLKVDINHSFTGKSPLKPRTQNFKGISPDLTKSSPNICNQMMLK